MEIVHVPNQIHEEVSRYRRKLSTLKRRNENLSEEISEKIEEITEAHFSDLAEELKSIDREITFEEIEQGIDNEDEELLKNRHVSEKEIKNAFYQIAKYTHPDKVGDDFIEEFKEAQEAYRNGDIDTLEELLELVDPNRESTIRNQSVEDAEATLERLKKSVEEEEALNKKIKSSLNYKIVTHYYSGDPIEKLKARSTLSDIMFKMIQQKTERLNQLRKSGRI